MSEARQAAIIKELEVWCNFLSSRLTAAAGDAGGLKAALAQEVAEKEKALAEVEVLRARVAELEAPRAMSGMIGQNMQSLNNQRGLLGDISGQQAAGPRLDVE